MFITSDKLQNYLVGRGDNPCLQARFDYQRCLNKILMSKLLRSGDFLVLCNKLNSFNLLF